MADRGERIGDDRDLSVPAEVGEVRADPFEQPDAHEHRVGPSRAHVDAQAAGRDEPRGDREGHLVRLRAVDGERGIDIAVHVAPLTQDPCRVLARADIEVRAPLERRLDAAGHRRDGPGQADPHPELRHPLPVRLEQHRAATGRDDDERRRRPEAREDLRLDGPEPRHPVLADDARARLPRPALDLIVQVDHAPAERLREQRRDRGLPDPGRSDEEEVHQRSAIGFRRSR